MNINLRTILKKPECIFLILGTFFGVISMFMMPVLTIPDEGAHFWMSYGMYSKNQQIPKDLLVSAEDSAKFVKDGTYIRKIYQDKVNFEGDTLQFNFTKDISLNSTNNDRYVSSLDISRTPQALGVLIGRVTYPSLGVMITLGRLFNLIFFIVAIYFIIKKIKYGKMALVFLALFPMMIHQAASLSYDVMNSVFIFAWVAYMINLFVQDESISKKQIAYLAALSLGLLLTKSNNVLLLILIPFLPSRLYKNTKLFTQIQKRLPHINISKRGLITFFGVSSVLILFALLLFFKAKLNQHGVNTGTFIKVLFNTFFQTNINTQLDPIVTTGIVGHFGWLWYKLPEWLVFVHLSIFGLILLGDKTPKVSFRFAMISALLLILSVIAITLGMYFMWTLLPFVAGVNAAFIQGVQGRYFTPLLILLIPTFAFIQNYISVRINPKLLAILAISMAIFSLVTYLALTYFFFY